jgi:pyruvate dehydrogenase E1 component alpha subunit
VIDHEHAVALLRQMVRIRRMEERCAEDYAAQKIRGFLHLYIGEEAVAVGVMQALAPEDAVIATYREHGHALVRGLPATAIMAEMYGRSGGCSRGRGGSMHLFSREHRFYGGHAIVGGLLPVAIGLGLADRLRGQNIVTAAFFGEGATAEGEFHESLNLASLWRLPVLFVCENNLYAMGTALERSEAEVEIHRKAAAHRIATEVVDGMDVVAVEDAARRAPTASAPTRCSTPSSIATSRRSNAGSSATRSRCSPRVRRTAARCATTTSPRSRPTRPPRSPPRARTPRRRRSSRSPTSRATS